MAAQSSHQVHFEIKIPQANDEFVGKIQSRIARQQNKTNK